MDKLMHLCNGFVLPADDFKNVDLNLTHWTAVFIDASMLTEPYAAWWDYMWMT